jgi:aspartate-semialdehyde dehydrogenase
MDNSKIKVAVLGATGLVGQRFVSLLADHPWFEIAALTASARSAGRPYGVAAGWVLGGNVPRSAAAIVISPGAAASLFEKGIRIAFSALPAAVALAIEAELREAGLAVFSNASAHRMDPDVPILIPEANAAHLELARGQVERHGGFIVANSNCTTSGLVLPLKALEPFGIRTVVVTSYQAITGAGRRGLPAFDIAANVIPHIGNEEDKLARETVKILGRSAGGAIEPAPFEVNASCARVSVRDGHLLSLALELEREVGAAEARRACEAFRGIPQELMLPTAPEAPLLVRPEDDRPQPVLDVEAGRPERARGMAVTVGRIRRSGRFLNMFALVHNTVRGAAGTSVLSAELAVRKGFVARRGGADSNLRETKP